MNLHNKIMNLPCDVDGVVAGDARLSFKLGHKQARHAAAELANEQEALVEQLVEALERVVAEFEELPGMVHDERAALEKARAALAAAKEQK